MAIKQRQQERQGVVVRTLEAIRDDMARCNANMYPIGNNTKQRWQEEIEQVLSLLSEPAAE